MVQGIHLMMIFIIPSLFISWNPPLLVGVFKIIWMHGINPLYHMYYSKGSTSAIGNRLVLMSFELTLITFELFLFVIIFPIEH